MLGEAFEAAKMGAAPTPPIGAGPDGGRQRIALG